jgi:hypothetical protein
VLEERGIRLISGYRSSSLKEFLIDSHSPPLVAFSGPSYVVFAELEEMRFRSDLRHRPSSVEGF